MERHAKDLACRAASRAGIWLLFAAFCVAQSGCGILRGGRQRKANAPEVSPQVAAARRPLQRVGVVTLVNEADHFVLIDSGSLPTPAVGAKLASYSGASPSSQLKASDVRRRPFVVADIVEGSPRAGDEVFEAAPPAVMGAQP